MKKKLVIAGVILVLISLFTWHLFSLAKVQCSLCVTFKDRIQCSTALGPNESQAQDEAHRNACALLAQGVTESVACERAPRAEMSCRQGQLEE